jgi:ubiquinone/menaquinone biosynthesis C-methylase UbiE
MVSDLLSPKKDDIILKAGCGYGRLSGTFLSAEAQVVGFDISISMIKYIKNRWNDYKADYKCSVADLTHLPFEDSTFDKVLCNGVLVHIEDPMAAVQELARVTKSDGYILIDGNSLLSPFSFWIWLNHRIRKKKDPEQKNVIFRIKLPFFYRNLLELNNCKIDKIMCDSIFVGEITLPILNRGFPPVRLIPLFAKLDGLSRYIPFMKMFGVEVWFLAKKK